MTITGVDLTGATAVDFGGAPATNVVVNSATQITATSRASRDRRRETRRATPNIIYTPPH